MAGRSGEADQDRLRRGFDTHDTVLACYSSDGFDAELQKAADEKSIMLFDLDRIYGG